VVWVFRNILGGDDHNRLEVGRYLSVRQSFAVNRREQQLPVVTLRLDLKKLQRTDRDKDSTPPTP